MMPTRARRIANASIMNSFGYISQPAYLRAEYGYRGD